MKLLWLLRTFWWWLEGSIVCYSNCPFNPGAWCKRRSHHFGQCRTGSGEVKWKNNSKEWRRRVMDAAKRSSNK